MHVLKQVRGQVERGHAVRVRFLKGQGTLREDFLEAGAERVERAAAGPLFSVAARGRIWGGATSSTPTS